MWRYLYCCYFCGKPVYQITFVCDKCLIVPKVKTRKQGQIAHDYLFEYNSYGEIFVKNLKYGKFSGALDKLVSRFLPIDASIIVMPNSKNLIREQNHSYVLAQKIFPGQEIFEPFYKLSAKQSLKSKKQREGLKLILLEKIELKPSVVLIDDLITTGKTIESAWNLLGKPHAKVISLCYTPVDKQIL